MVQTQLAARPTAEGSNADARRREILEAASRVFRRKGFAATGMRDIAAELGCTAGNLYYYFGSKEELLAFCQETTLDELLSEAEQIQRLSIPSGEKLSRLLVAHVRCLNESYPGSLAHLEIETLGATRRAPLIDKRRRYERTISSWIEAGIAAGELVTDDPSLATRALLGAVNWTVKWFSPQGERSASEVGESFAGLFLNGLQPR